MELRIDLFWLKVYSFEEIEETSKIRPVEPFYFDEVNLR